MREFKFIRGIYKDESVFNSDEKTNGLFACDKNGDNIRLNVKNDKDFQENVVKLSSNGQVSKLYVIRPSQIVINGEKISDGSYSYEYSLKDETFDHLKDLSSNETAKTKVTSYLKEKTKCTFDDVPDICFENETARTTSVDFLFQDDYKSKNFSRELYFKVTGKLTQITSENANGETVRAYLDVKDMLGDPNDTGAFMNGKKQIPVDPTPMNVAQESIQVNNINYNELSVATRYEAMSNCKFKISNSPYIYYYEIAANNAYDGFDMIDTTNGALKLTCEVDRLNEHPNTIVRLYAESFKDYKTFNNGQLVMVEDELLENKESINVYPSNSHTINGGTNVYIDSSDTNTYLMLNEMKDINIDNANATIDNEGNVSPSQIEGNDNVFRQIKEGTLKITATEVQSY